jgi:HEAT repeat protein
VPAVDELAEALKDPNSRTRYYAAKSLAEIGPDAEPAKPALAATLADEDPDTRYYVAKALSKVDLDADDAPAVVPGLTKLLKDANPKTRYYAAKCLRELGPAGSAAAPALNDAARDPDREVREAAAAALKKVARKP